MFDPAYPPTNAELESAPLRGQFNGLKDLIDAQSAINAATVDGVTTVNPGDPAQASVSVVDNTLHFTFSIPRGGDGAQGGTGDTGAQGPPFAQAIIDAVNTLNPGEPATAQVGYDGSNVHFTFGIPEGQTGEPGEQGPPGEVTNADLNAALALKAQNPSTVNTLPGGAPGSYDQLQMQEMIDKMNELITALK